MPVSSKRNSIRTLAYYYENFQIGEEFYVIHCGNEYKLVPVEVDRSHETHCKECFLHGMCLTPDFAIPACTEMYREDQKECIFKLVSEDY